MLLALGTLLSGLLPLGERALLAPHPAPRGLAHSRGGAARACSSSKTLVSARAVVVMAVRRPRPMQQAPRVQDDIPINEGIQFDTMRVMIDVPGEADQMLGVMSKAQALAEAEKLNLDLVLIAPKSEPPVCKIVSYDKFRYNREKKKKEQKAAASKGQELKELKMSYKIGEHDYDVRKKQAIRFLKQGNKVKFSMLFRGREITHAEVGQKIMLDMAKALEEIGVLDGQPKILGKQMIMMISPKGGS